METLGGLPELKEELETFRELYGGGDAKHDLALARFVSLSCGRHTCAMCTWSFTACFRAGDWEFIFVSFDLFLFHEMM